MKREDADTGKGNNLSPRNGTVIDRGITTTKLCNFYLQVHAAITGTVDIPTPMLLMPC